MPGQAAWRDVRGAGACCIAAARSPCDVAPGGVARNSPSGARRAYYPRWAPGVRVRPWLGRVCGAGRAAGYDRSDPQGAGELARNGSVPAWPRPGGKRGGGVGDDPVSAPLLAHVAMTGDRVDGQEWMLDLNRTCLILTVIRA